MRSRIKYYGLYFSLALLTGCASVVQQPAQVSLGIDGVACIGSVNSPPVGLEEMEDKVLLEKALGSSGAGKLCSGKVFRVTQPVKVYRVWNSEKSYTLYGGWWSFTLPKGPQDRYRQDNEICPSWSKLDRMSICTIRVGTSIVVGTGQSADCMQDQLSYPKSAVNQVFIPNDSRAGSILVEGCTAGDSWP